MKTLSTETVLDDQRSRSPSAHEFDEPIPSLQGLSLEEVEQRRSHGLGNNVAFKTSRTLGQILRENLFTFFNIVLVVLGALLVIFGLVVEALITSGVLLVNVVIASFQEVRAKQNLDHIALLTRPKAIAIRQGKEMEVDPAEIVLDDLLCLRPGDQVVVDGKIISGGRIDVDESLLTGESALVPKYEGDQVYSGSFCVTGRGIYRATKVGVNSFANKLTLEARIFTRHYTPLQREVNLSIRLLMAMVIFFGVLLIINNLLDDVPMAQSVSEASVLFGLAPSSLFLMIVVAYGVGAVRISSRGALVQQANSVESLCNVDVLCLDKTGTLTTNRINLEEVYLPEVERDGLSSEEVLARLGDFSASVTETNRTNDAIARVYPGKERPFSQQMPFSSQHGWSALVFDGQEQPGTYVLGAPELLFPVVTGTSELVEKANSWFSQGRRVLLFAYHPQATALRDGDDQPLLPGELKALSLLGFSDELRPRVQETLRGFVEAGISLKFISGDNPDTVASLVRQAGFLDDERVAVVSGLQLAEMDETQFDRSAVRGNIFGRITPRQKEQLIRALVDQGNYVAMTGDGINDILALKRANLGIAMQSGSEATRNVADIVLLEDSFGILPEAFQEGQRILNGIQDILRLYMSRILCLALLIAAIGFASNGFPITPRQNAIVGFITMSIPAFFLTLWAKPGHSPRISLSRKLAHFVIPAMIITGAVGFSLYLYSLVTSGDETYAQTILTYFTVISGILLLIFVEPPTQWWVGGDEFSGDWRPTILAVALLVLSGILVAVPTSREFYGLTLLRQPGHYFLVFLATIVWLFGLRFAWRVRLFERYLNLNRFS